MSNVVQFAAFLNQRRASAQIAEQEAAAAAREIEMQRARAAEVAKELGGGHAAQVVGTLIAAVDAEQREKSKGHKFMPAYCDPTNEVQGSKYQATRGLAPKEISARIRQDIKAAQKAGTLPAGAKFSVRMDSYSGGWSIDVRVTALPDDFRVTSEKYASWVKQFGRDQATRVPMAWCETRSDEYNALLQALAAIRGAYNRDNSDSSVDFFDYRFGGSVEIDWQVRDALEAKEVAASAGTYWAAESCGAAR